MSDDELDAVYTHLCQALGAQGEALGGHRVDGDEIFGEVAVGFEGGAHAGEHDVLLGQGVVGVHEINGDAVQAAQADFLVMGVGRRAAAELPF